MLRLLHSLRVALRPRTRYRSVRSDASTLGVRGAVLLSLQRERLRFLPRNALLTLTAREAAHPLRCRAQTSDLKVFKQIFVERAFACLDDVEDAALVIDCGANVGYAAAYFLSRFPRAELVAVEPDPDNFALLERNLTRYGQRARAVRAALWSHPADLVLEDRPYRDSAEWARQVRVCRPGETPRLRGVDVTGLLRESGHERISILKMDIEGAEAVVFGSNYEGWIDRVDHLVVEIHDDSGFGDATGAFERAIAGHGFVVSRWGELTVCRRVAAPVPAGQITPSTSDWASRSRK
ncbi:MAG TPA: FkbM family methyltransferase [Gemmatimonadaceae bacterium]|nr:FkbM family methyltransferase [Gemmatimonadaceae bacterium]